MTDIQTAPAASEARMVALSAIRVREGFNPRAHFDQAALERMAQTMRQTGVDMSEKYKETSLGGLAVNVVEC